jgi:hypothetical protein
MRMIDFDSIDGERQFWHSGAGRREEVGRCIGCGLLCEAYFCDSCAYGSEFVRGRFYETPPVTPTRVGKGRRRLQERATASAIWYELQTSNDEVIAKRRIANDPRIDKDERASLSRNPVASAPMIVGPFFDTYASSTKRKAARIERKREERRLRMRALRAQRKVEREWWIFWLGEWGAIGWVIVDELTKPEAR